jgi:hypothetical protein
MTATLERRYRLLMRSYPQTWLDQRGEALIGTLMEISEPGQRWPKPREASSLLLSGIRVRAGADRLESPGQAWRDSAPPTVVLLLALQIVVQVWLTVFSLLEDDGPPVGWQLLAQPAVTCAIAGGAALALLAARPRLGVALALLTPLPAVLPPLNYTWDNYYVFTVVVWWLPVIGLAIPLLRQPSAPGPWRWQLALPLLVLASLLVPLSGLPYLVALAATAILLAACLVWGIVIDPRPAIALGLLLLLTIPQLLVTSAALVLVLPVFFLGGGALLATGAARAAHRNPA